MLSITDDLDDIYEEFLALTSSSSSSSVVFSTESNSLQPPPPYLPEFYNFDLPPPPHDSIQEDMNRQQWRIPGQGHTSHNPSLAPWLYNREHLYNRLEAMMTAASAPPPPPPPDVKPSTVLLNYPSGMEVIFRQVPSGCHALLMSSDIPDSALQRGYFTVAELLTLKRLLISRYTGQPVVQTNVDRQKVVSSRRGVKRSYEGQQPESEKVSVIRCISSVSGVGGVVKEAMTVLDDHQGSTGGAASAQ